MESINIEGSLDLIIGMDFNNQPSNLENNGLKRWKL